MRDRMISSFSTAWETDQWQTPRRRVGWAASRAATPHAPRLTKGGPMEQPAKRQHRSEDAHGNHLYKLHINLHCFFARPTVRLQICDSRALLQYAYNQPLAIQRRSWAFCPSSIASRYMPNRASRAYLSRDQTGSFEARKLCYRNTKDVFPQIHRPPAPFQTVFFRLIALYFVGFSHTTF